jgi:hypothetical protein
LVGERLAAPEDDKLFLCLKEKVTKRSKPTCRWTACAPINCVDTAFSVPEIADAR